MKKLIKHIWKYNRVWLIVSLVIVLIVTSASVVVTQNVFLSNTVSTILGRERSVLVSGDPSAYQYYTKSTSDFQQFMPTVSSFNVDANGNALSAQQQKQLVLQQAMLLNEEIASEGFVLLKNTDNALPLTGQNVKISVFGKNSVNLVYGGSGSGGGNAANNMSLYTALRNEGFDVNPTLESFYNSSESGEGRDSNPAIGASTTGLAIGETPQAKYTAAVKNSYDAYHDVALIVLSRIGGEGFDLPRTMVTSYGGANVAGAKDGQHYLELDQNEEDLIHEVVSRGKFGKVVVVINCATSMELGFIEEMEGIDAAIWIGSPGSSGINALGKILNGSVNPSGRLVDTFATDFTAAPSYKNFGDNLSDGGNQYMLGGSGSGYYYVEYEEGICVGYRYYETKAYDEADFGNDDWYKENVVYPFGYGLSYTTFDWKIADSTDNSVDLTADGEIQVQVKVTNTGSVAGKDVVQLYYTAPYKAGQIEKSYVALGAYEKTALLQPGESDIVTLSLPVESMASYDYDDANHNGHKGYEVEGGNYAIRIGRNAHQCWNDNPLRITYHVPADGFFYDAGVTEGSTVENRFDYMSEHFVDEETGVSTLMTREDFRGKTIAAPTAEEREVDADFIQSMTFTYDDENEPYYTAQTYQQGVTADKYIQLYELLQKDEDGKWAADYDDPRWETILDYLTVDEMANMIGTGNFNTAKIDRIGKPATIDPDGPAGFTNFMGDPSVHDTCFYVSECVVGATWNKQLAHDMGVMIGIEGLVGYTNGDGRTYSGWYAPAVNIHRSPFSGRNWEYYSEDPLLTGLMGANVVNGANSKGVYTYVKHFVLNDQETNRDANGLVTWADEQTMREIYLKPFEIIVKQADTKGIMSSFNRIGNVWTGGSYTLLTDVLRKEWGFVGMVITDYSVQNAYMPPNQMIRAGGDLYLTQGYLPSTTGSAVNSTHLAAMRQAVKNILYVVTNSNAMNGKGEGIVYRYAMPYWQIGLIALNVVMWLFVVLIGVIRIRKTKKKHPIQ